MPQTKTNLTISWWFVAAAALALFTCAIHVLAGTPEILLPMLASDLPPTVKGVLDVIWHQITALLLVSSVALLLAARRPTWRVPLASVIGVHFALIALIFLALGAAWFSSPWPMPQWLLFGAVPIVLLLGCRYQPV